MTPVWVPVLPSSATVPGSGRTMWPKLARSKVMIVKLGTCLEPGEEKLFPSAAVKLEDRSLESWGALHGESLPENEANFWVRIDRQKSLLILFQPWIQLCLKPYCIWTFQVCESVVPLFYCFQLDFCHLQQEKWSVNYGRGPNPQANNAFYISNELF